VTGVYGITLRKKHDGFGGLPKGSEYRAVFREERSPHDAAERAFRMLKRDRPSENPMAWEFIDEMSPSRPENERG
jgi:hypothetical protein